VKSLNIAWPAPHRFTDDSGATIGYKNGVIFPLRIVPQDPAKPVLLRLKLDYAVCEKLCVPAEGRAELVLDGTPSAFDAALAKADALVPKPAKPGDDAPLAVRAVRQEPGGDRPRVVVDVAAPGNEPIELFAEDRRPNGPCRCPNRPTAQAPDCTGSPSARRLPARRQRRGGDPDIHPGVGRQRG